jgi:MoaA/NifB/PqqE/SkfB family radical SAM enzyme
MRAAERARLALAYGSSFLSWAVEGAPRPFSASFAVTDKCNLRCDYCNFPYLKTRDLELDAIGRLFDRLREMGVERLGLVGGEPMVRKDLSEIVTAAKQRGFYVTMNTNLTLYARYPRVLDAVDHIFTSLDGDPSEHLANRGEDSLDGVVAGIQKLVAAGKPVTPICVVRRGDVEMARRLLERAVTLGVRVHFQPQCIEADIVRGGLPDGISNEALRNFWAELLALKTSGLPVASSSGYLRTLAGWHDFSISAIKSPDDRCAAGRGFLFIDPEGNASPCAYTRGKMTPINLLSEDWRQAWDRETPCTRCSVGPMLELNLLFQKPLQSARSALQSYAS